MLIGGAWGAFDPEFVKYITHDTFSLQDLTPKTEKVCTLYMQSIWCETRTGGEKDWKSHDVRPAPPLALSMFAALHQGMKLYCVCVSLGIRQQD